MKAGNRYSVVISGAGPTGLVLANLLGKAGVDTLLLEAKADTVSEPRAVSIDDESLRVVQSLGLLDVVTRELVSGYGSDYLGPDGRVFLKVDPKARPYGHPRRNAFRQPIFEAQLREGLRRFPSVETRFLTRLASFRSDAEGVELLIESEGAAQSLRAEFLIGCDGSWSPVREALGFTLAGSSLDERWLIIDLEDSPAPSRQTIVFCDPRRPGIALPGPDSTRRYEFKLLEGETDAHLLENAFVNELLRTHDAAPQSRVVRKTVYHFHARIADGWGRGRVWLAGDAAHLMPPFAGQGMNSGVRDAANLAWKLAAIVNGRLGPGLLETYEAERRHHVGQMIQLAVRMGRVFGPPTPLFGLATRMFFRTIGIWPQARSYFAEMKYKPPPRFKDGFIVRSQVSRKGLVGRMLPQPELDRETRGVLLDSLLGEGFALVGVDVEPEALERVALSPVLAGLAPQRLSLTTREVPSLASEAGYVLLVRPDRYVMARFKPDRSTMVLAEIERLVGRTWRSSRLGSRPS